ncbi:MAG: ABC transporter permease [Candidatus Omnitrophica bacterium]|nr:ABC transporter permease [Candidatus Omnitrophota bacterium]
MLSIKISNIYAYRHTIWDTAIKQLNSRYAGSIMGIWLAIVNPLLIMLAVTFVFQVIFKVAIQRFFLFALAGIFPWLFFSNALFEGAFSILGQRSVLHQFSIPREIIPLSSVLSNFLNFLIGWCIVLPLFIIFNPGLILLIPLLVIVLLLNLIFTIGLVLSLSVLNVFFRDIGHIMGVLLMFWFWITPVFYTVDMVPAGFRWISYLNPMTPYITYYREVLFNAAIPSLPVFLGVFLWALVSLISGILIFWRLEPTLLKRM